MTSITVTIVASDPPFTTAHGVLFGLQTKHEVDDPVPAHATCEFQTDIDVQAINGMIDFRGTHVHGSRGDRFLYLAWGRPDPPMPFVMFARAKIKLAGIPDDVLDLSMNGEQRLVADLQATNNRGQPASGTIKSPDIRWAVDKDRTTLRRPTVHRI